MRNLPIALAIVAISAMPAAAEPTRVMVRALSNDAKFIGSSMGGVRITVRDARSKRVLVKGITSGGTGDTRRLVTQPYERGGIRSDEKSAGFEAMLDIAEPTLIQIEGVGPVGKPGAAITVTSNLWVLPGRNLTGDGLILTFPGLVVEPELLMESDGLRIEAKVTLMCGCPLEPGGTWEAANYTVVARLIQGHREIAGSAMKFAGTPSQYVALISGVPKGRYTLQVTAMDKSTINAGVGEKRVQVR